MEINPRRYRAVYGTIAAVIIAVIFLASGLVVSRKIDSYFTEIQKEATVQNIRIVEGIFGRVIRSLSILATDWSMWDQMYDYALDPESDLNRQFAEDNFQDSTFSEIDVHVILIVAENGDVIFSKQVYDQSPGENDVPRAVLDAAKEMFQKNMNKNVASEDTDGSYVSENNIINVGAKKLLLASEHITRSDGTGKPVGMVFLGRYTGSDFISGFENIPAFYFNVYPYDPKSQSVPYVGISEKNPLVVRLENSRMVTAMKLIDNISSDRLFVLEIKHMPTFYSRFIDIVIFVVIIASLAYIMTMLAVIVLFARICPVSRKCQYDTEEKVKKMPKAIKLN